MVHQVHVLPVTVECVSCATPSSPHQLVSHSAPVVLSGQCSQCGGQTQVIFTPLVHAVMNLAKCLNQKTFLFEILILLLLLSYINIQQPTFIDRD